MEVSPMAAAACIGFSGRVVDGLHTVDGRDGQFVAYPLGAMVVVKHASRKDGVAFLQGHSRAVSTVAVSHDARWLASGQTNQLGVEAPVILWDLSEACTRACDSRDCSPVRPARVLQLHLADVQGMAFSCDDKYLATLGGRDDNKLVVWVVKTGVAICSVAAAPDTVLAVRWLNQRNDRLVTCGNFHVRVWQIDESGPRIHAMDAKMGKMRRVLQCVAVTSDDAYAICGTQTGELVQVDIERDAIQSYNDPDKRVPRLVGTSSERFGRGVKSVVCCHKASSRGDDIVCVGAGDGTVAFYGFTREERAIAQIKAWQIAVSGGVTSLSYHPASSRVAIGTELCNRYEHELGRECAALRATAHVGAVRDVCFPALTSAVFVTCSVSDIRVWDSAARAEILRVEVPNLECGCVGVTATGDLIVSGWSDGKVRAFGPESGKLKFAIPDAHLEHVTALALVREGSCVDPGSSRPWRLLTGGADGRVRVWSVSKSHQSLLHSLKEHRSHVTCIQINTERDQAISSSTDGACLVWCLERYVRLAALQEPTLFRAVLYHPDSSQILTCGSNAKISYWEAASGDAIRVVHAGDAEMTALDMSKKGGFFVSGSNDKSVKLWDYDLGIHTHQGRAHSGNIEAVKISPDQETIVSVGAEGGIVLWPIANLLNGLK